jgi:hypothetical protein
VKTYLGRSFAVLVTAGLLAAMLGFLQTGRGARAKAAGAAQLPTAGDVATPDLGLPATGVVTIGTSAGETPGEVWAYGVVAGESALLERSDATGWRVLALPSGVGGSPAEYGAFAGQSTLAGGVALLSGQSVIVREPGGQPRSAPAPIAQPATGGVLAAGESLLPTDPAGAVTLPYAAIEDTGGHTGVLIAPSNDGGDSPSTRLQPGVLHYNGSQWTREPIELADEQEANGFTALALACAGTSSAPASSAPGNCWLLAGYDVGSRQPNRLVLFRRVASSDPSGYTWEPQQVASGPLHEQSGVAIAPLAQGAQMLTATAQGVWVDFQAQINPTGPGHGPEPSDVSELIIPNGHAAADVLGPWCYPTGAACSERTLGGSLPAQYRSFAEPGASATEVGARVITGLPHRAMLELAGPGADSSFLYTVGAGGELGSVPGAAAFFPAHAGAPWEGWIADGIETANAADGEGQSPAIELAPNGPANELGEESVPFRRPLYALAQAPGTAPGDPSAAAIAVGEKGQIAHYSPGEGWRPEALYDSNGGALTPTLRGVAWPEPGRAYAVGDEGTMWLWRAETGLWEPDPATPLNFIGNLTAIAFSPGEPSLGYAVGKQGVLLKYGKSWEQVPLPPELRQANFTSVAFAGGEALASYRLVERVPGSQSEFMETGGLAVEEDGSGLHWHVDPGASALLQGGVLSRVAGLPDGGAVAAGPGTVIERDSPSSGWRFSSQPLPEAQNISALAAYRDSTGVVRAVVSIDLDERLGPRYFAGVNLEQGAFKVDLPAPAAAGQPSTFLEPDPLPNSGYVLKENADGWSDMEHEALPAPGGKLPQDMPARPDPALALIVSSNGEQGLAVGGQTGDIEGRGLSPALHSNNIHDQTAAAMRFPAGAASADGRSTSTSIVAPAGEASFVVAGQAACVQSSCADFAEEGLGPDAWLTHAIQSADAIAAASGGGLRAFLYTGGRLPTPTRGGGGEEFSRGLDRYAALLDGGSLPTYPAASATDLAQGGAGIEPFTQMAVPPGVTRGPAGTAAYSFISNGGSGGLVKSIVLDFSNGSLQASGTSAPNAQENWLEQELVIAKEAKITAIVMGNDALGFTLPQSSESPNQASDAAAVAKMLVQGEASAYFFDYPGANVKTVVRYGADSIPAYGTGTLGYVDPPDERFEGGSLGSSGFLLASVDTSAARKATRPNVVPVTAEVIPNIGQLALDATDGVLMRRSHVGLFDALARRPMAGVSVGFGNGNELQGPDPYDQIPFNCQGANCVYEVPTQYTFTSSNPDIANFVTHEAGSGNPRQVELGPNKLPTSDFRSGLLCAYNEGTTIVSITTGGLTYSEPVTVQGGSVEYPCGTVPLKNPPRAPVREAGFANLGAAPASQPPQSAGPQAVRFPPAPAPSPAPAPHPAAHPAPILFFPLVSPVAGARPVIVPPPGPPVARPAPPSGTAEVSQTVGAAEKEREEEQATDLVSTNFSAYHPDEGPRLGPWLAFPLLMIVAGAGLAVGRSGRSRRHRQAARGISPARASVSARRTRA